MEPRFEWAIIDKLNLNVWYNYLLGHSVWNSLDWICWSRQPFIWKVCFTKNSLAYIVCFFKVHRPAHLSDMCTSACSRDRDEYEFTETLVEWTKLPLNPASAPPCTIPRVKLMITVRAVHHHSNEALQSYCYLGRRSPWCHANLSIFICHFCWKAWVQSKKEVFWISPLNQQCLQVLCKKRVCVTHFCATRMNCFFYSMFDNVYESYHSNVLSDLFNIRKEF